MKNFLFLLLFVPLSLIAQKVPLEGVVKMHNNKPTIFLNNQPVSPQFYALTHAYGARWSWEEVPSRNLKNFCEIGYRLYQVDLYFQDIWFKDRVELDMDKVRKQVKGVLDVCPDAAIVIRVHVNAPYWWNEENRAECTKYADAPVDTRSYGPPNDNENGDVEHPLRASLASLKWRAEASKRLVEFCERLASTEEGKSVFGLHISCGVYGEWHYWGFPDHDPDTGPAMTQYFKNWLRLKYTTDKALQKAWNNIAVSFETVTIPDKKERDTTMDGVFRNPQLERRVIDYYECQQYVVAEDIVHFSKVAKQSWPRPLVVGVFYNYFFMTFSRQAVGGHLQNEMILKCPYIDYLSAPLSYWGGARKIGGSGQSRGLIESTIKNGKLWLDEMDQNSYKGGPFNAGFQTTKLQDVAIIRRNLAQSLTRGGGYWFYDFGPYRSSGWWDDTLFMNDISKQREILDKYYKQPFDRQADVLFVYNNATFFHIKNKYTPVSSFSLLDQASLDAFQSGALLDQVFIEDLDKINLKQYKTIVFSNAFHLTEAQRKMIKEKVAKGGRTIVWNYMPGYTDGKQNSIIGIENLTGLKVEKIRFDEKLSIKSINADFPLVKNQETSTPVSPLLKIADKNITVLGVNTKTGEVMTARKAFADHTVWFSTYLFDQPQVFKNIFKSSGAHIYGDGNEVFHEGGGILMVHTKEGGTKTIMLRNSKKVSLIMKPETTVYLDSETGEVLLQ